MSQKCLDISNQFIIKKKGKNDRFCCSANFLDTFERAKISLELR